MALTSAGTLTATSMTAFDLSAAVASGSTYAYILFQNINEFPVRIHYGQTGTSEDIPLSLAPGDYTTPIKITLTSARTVLAYIEGGGSATVWVESYGGTGLSPTSVLVSDIRTTLLDSGYSTSDISDNAIQGYIDIINAEVTDAATRHANIAGFTLNTSIKTNAIKMGALAQTLYSLRTKGALRGLTSDMIIISNETADRYNAKYQEILAGIESGIKYGA